MNFGGLKGAPLQQDEALRIAHGKRAEEHAINKAENRGIRADAKSESENSNGGKTGVLCQQLETESQVLPKCSHGKSPELKRRAWIHVPARSQ